MQNRSNLKYSSLWVSTKSPLMLMLRFSKKCLTEEFNVISFPRERHVSVHSSSEPRRSAPLGLDSPSKASCKPHSLFPGAHVGRQASHLLRQEAGCVFDERVVARATEGCADIPTDIRQSQLIVGFRIPINRQNPRFGTAIIAYIPAISPMPRRSRGMTLVAATIF